jgi:hypothetical protein
MKSGDPTIPASLSAANDESTGLPGLRTWPLVYLVVFASFVIWVVLLLVLEGFFS